MNSNNQSNYGEFCKPNLFDQLQSMSLDINYYKADGNYLYYKKEDKDIKVLDLIGGFGTLIFGHNHPKLSTVLQTKLADKAPFAAQGSIREDAGKLAFLLNSMLKERFSEDYLTILSNSGAEAVEITIKHAFYTHYHKKQVLKAKVDSSLKKLEIKSLPELTIETSLVESLQDIFPDEKVNPDFLSIARLIKNYNDQELANPPFLIGLKKAFHGKTIGAIQITYNNEYKKELLKTGPKVIHINQNDFDDFERVVNEGNRFFYTLKIEDKVLKLDKVPFSSVAAFIIEPIQGEGGMNVIDKDFLEKADKICKHLNIPVAMDEVQTGMGRTGTFLFSEQLGITPDYFMLSKGLGGGLTKVGATLIPRRIFGDEFDKIHSSTFAEDALSASVAYESVNLLIKNPDLLENIKEKEVYFKQKIHEISKAFPGIIKEIRGKGLLLGIEFETPELSGSNCLRLLYDQDVLGFVICGLLLHEFNIRTLPCLSNKQVIRIEPSAYISQKECDYFLIALARVCEILYKENMYELCKFLVGRTSEFPDNEIRNYRKPPFKKHNLECKKKVAFIGHFVHATDMIDWDDSFEMFSESELEELLETIYPLISPFLSDRKVITSKTGEKVQLDMMGFVITSKIIARHMQKRDLDSLLDKINECIELAKENGCTLVGFGGFTSIVTGNCKNITIDSIGFTTGNSFTTAMGMEAMLSEAGSLDIDIEQATFAAVGAGGNISSVYSELMAENSKKVILIGSKGRLKNIENLALKIFKTALTSVINNNVCGIARLLIKSDIIDSLTLSDLEETNITNLFEHFRKELGEDFPIVVSDDLSLIKEANLIVAATNSPLPVIFPEMLGKHATIICDIALPFDVDNSVHTMDSVRVIQGGIVKIPGSSDYKIAGIKLPEGTAYACMSETILLGLEGVENNYSYGNISPDQVKEIYKISKTHGFQLEHSKLERSF